jgi:hypothetical protein
MIRLGPKARRSLPGRKLRTADQGNARFREDFPVEEDAA